MPPPAPEDVALRTALEAAGRRYTRQRQAIYGYLGSSTHHPTAEEVYQGVRGTVPNLSLATVYKALEAFEACGLVARIPDGGGSGSARYDARGDGHYHLR